MRCASRFACLCFLSCMVVWGCSRGAPQPPQANNPPAPVETKLMIGDPIQVKNLTIFPVLSSEARDEDRFITLDEGTRAGTVAVFELGTLPDVNADADATPAVADDPFSPVYPPAATPVANADVGAIPEDLFDEEATSDAKADVKLEQAAAVPDDAIPPDEAPDAEMRAEVTPPDEAPDATLPVALRDDRFGGDSPDVNRVVVVNKSDKSLYLMPGETIVGGQQDRVLAEEKIIPPGGKPVTVAVFCVEHGRWNTRGETETSSLAAVYPVGDLVVPAQFAPGKSSLHKQGRIAVQEAKNQSQVWDEVAKANTKSGNDAATGAYTSNFGGEKAGADLQAYLDGLEANVGKRERIVGVVVAINGKVESMDVFESTPLFRKLWPKLIQGHALDAANAAGEDESDEANRPCPLADAQRFYDEATSGEIASTRATGGLVLTGRASQGVISFSVNDGEMPSESGKRNGAGGAGGMGGMGGMMGGAGGMGGVHTSGFSK